MTAPPEAPSHPEVQALLARATMLSRAEHTERADAADTQRKLNTHGIDDAEIARQLSSLSSNTAPNKTAPITTYSWLHGLQHLDAIHRERAMVDRDTDVTLALFRSAEACAFTVGVLSSRMLENLQAGRLSEALGNARWRQGLHHLLYKLSLLVAEVPVGSGSPSVLSIGDSRIVREAGARNEALQRWLMTEWPEPVNDVFGKDLDDPQRHIFFHEFVNTGEERIWMSLFSRVAVSGLPCHAGEDDAGFYARIVNTAQVEQMLTAMETEAETDLLGFRLVHQVSETLAAAVNAHACHAATVLLTAPRGHLEPALHSLRLGNRLLTAVDDSIHVMLRTLTPRAYSAIRPNLGMVRGTSSRVLRKTLFNGTYPLLVRACALRLTGFDSKADEAQVEDEARAVRLDEARDPLFGAILQQVVVLHQHARTWRDNHVQLPKTHLGVSPIPDQPTVSLSGSDSAVDVAHELRRVHATDPIVPIYRAVLGSDPPPVHEMLSDDGFDAHMAQTTARAVLGVYEPVQERFRRRCPVRHNGGAAGDH